MIDLYAQALKDNPEYTVVPQEYYKSQAILQTTEYVKLKLNKQQVSLNELYQACQDYPEVFAQWMLGITLRDYQRYAIDVMLNSNDVAMAWSRRCGKSTITKVYMLYTTIFNKLPGDMTGTTWNIILQDQEIANSLYIEPLHEMMEKGDKVVDTNFKGLLGSNFFTSRLVTKRDKSGKVRVNQISFRMPDTNAICRINALPPSKKAIGREGNIIGDEVSKWKDNPKCTDEFKFYDQLIAIKKDKPTLKAIFLSTPEGDEDMFAKEIFDPKQANPHNRYAKIWYPWQVRNQEHWIKEMMKTKKEAEQNGRLATFRQEYEATFETIAEPFFHVEKVLSNLDNNWHKDTTTTPCSLGIDWGGSLKSETAIVITEWTTNQADKPKTIYIKHYPVGDDLLYLEQDLKNISKAYNVKWVIPDNKGGRWMIPTLENIFGKHKLEQFNFTTDKKEGYELLRQAIIDKTIQTPAHTELIKQIKTLNEKLKPANAIAKDDVVDAWMMAMYPILKHKPKTFKVWAY